MLITTTRSPENAFGEKPRRFLKDKYTAHAAVLTACGITIGKSKNNSLTQDQLKDLLKLLDEPNTYEKINSYLARLDVARNE